VTYTLLALLGVVFAIAVDLFVTRSRILAQGRFYFAWALLIFFQLISNGWLTGRDIVMYDEDMILGWRLVYAPVEDLLFGFALIVFTLSVWVRVGKTTTEDSQRVSQRQSGL
jgi:lycopene cyclase domain-containing protein